MWTAGQSPKGWRRGSLLAFALDREATLEARGTPDEAGVFGAWLAKGLRRQLVCLRAGKVMRVDVATQSGPHLDPERVHQAGMSVCFRGANGQPV